MALDEKARMEGEADRPNRARETSAGRRTGVSGR